MLENTNGTTLPAEQAASALPQRRAARRWRPWRFSLAGLLLTLTLCAVAFAYVRTCEQHYLADAAARIKVQEWGGSTETRSVPAGWVGRLLGKERWEETRELNFYTISAITTDGNCMTFMPTVTDEQLPAVRAFPKLERLMLDQAPITRRGLACLGELRSLTELTIVAHPAARDEEQGASLVETSPRDFEFLTQLKKLRALQLQYLHIEDADLVHVEQLNALETLTISNTPLTGAELQRLARLTNLTSLNLSYTAVNDAGIARLPPLPRLETICLRGTQATDAVWPHLDQLPQLKTLQLDTTAVTADAAKEFARRHPGCEIDLLDPPGEALP